MGDSTGFDDDRTGREAAASGRFLLRMEPGLHAALRAAARAAGMSLNDYCVRKLAMPAHPGTAAAAAATVTARAAEVAGAALVGVVVFGSWARGETTAASDVDVLVVVAPELAVTRELYRAWDATPLEWSGRPVEPHFARLPEPDAPWSGLWAEVAIDGVVLFERDLAVSRRLAAVRSRIAAGQAVRRFSNGHPYWVAA
jgi:predicted nucleotidyltransferase